METENKTLPQGLEIPDNKNQIRWVKAAVLAALATIGFGFTWYLLSVGLATNHNLIFWLYPSLTGAFAVSFLALLIMVNINLWLFWVTNVLVLVSYLLILPKNIYVFVGGGLFFVFVWLFERRIRQDEHSRADFSVSRILRSGINLMVYALLIVLGFNLYNLIRNDLQTNPVKVYDKIGYYAARGLNYVPSNFGNFDSDQTFNDFVTNQARQQAPEFNQAPQSVQNQAIEELRKQLIERFHLNVSGNPLLSQVVSGAVSDRAQQAGESYSNFFPAIFTVILIIILRYTAFLFVWLTELICWSIYHLLLKLKFLRIEKVQVEVDKLTI